MLVITLSLTYHRNWDVFWPEVRLLSSSPLQNPKTFSNLRGLKIEQSKYIRSTSAMVSPQLRNMSLSRAASFKTNSSWQSCWWACLMGLQRQCRGNGRRNAYSGTPCLSKNIRSTSAMVSPQLRNMSPSRAASFKTSLGNPAGGRVSWD